VGVTCIQPRGILLCTVGKVSGLSLSSQEGSKSLTLITLSSTGLDFKTLPP
jgi:hypothetical protein